MPLRKLYDYGLLIFSAALLALIPFPSQYPCIPLNLLSMFCALKVYMILSRLQSPAIGMKTTATNPLFRTGLDCGATLSVTSIHDVLSCVRIISMIFDLHDLFDTIERNTFQCRPPRDEQRDHILCLTLRTGTVFNLSSSRSIRFTVM